MMILKFYKFLELKKNGSGNGPNDFQNDAKDYLELKFDFFQL